MEPIWKEVARRLGVRKGRILRPAFSADGVPEVLEAGDPDRRFLAVTTADSASGAGERRLIRIGTAVEGLEVRAMREYRALLSKGLPRQGTCRPDFELASPPARPDVLPPLLYCRHKRVWIAATCTHHESEPGSADGSACAVCGGAERGACKFTGPLESLWRGVTQGQEPAPARAGDEKFPAPACLTCERRQGCFPASGSPTEPKGALEALILVQPRPWTGLVVESIDVSLGEWVQLIQGSATSGEPEPDQAPSDSEARPRRLVPTEFRSRAAAEDLLLRLDAFRQLLTTLSALLANFGHNHGELRPETIWFRLGEAVGPVPAWWPTEALLLDVAPGDEESESRMPLALRPPNQGSAPFFTGVLTPLGEVADEPGRSGAKYLFILEEGQVCAEPPASGIEISVSAEGAHGEVVCEGTIETAHDDVFRLVIYSGESSSSEALAAHGKSVTVSLGKRPTGEIDRDLFALGTLWTGLLRSGEFDLDAAASLRDRLRTALEQAGIDPHDHVASARCCQTTAIAAGEALVKPLPGIDVESSAEADLLGRCLWIGLRMAAELPGDGLAATNVALEHLIQETQALVDEARYIMLGRPTQEEEILCVIETIEKQRLQG